MESFWQDVRYAVRGLARNPGFMLLAAFTLALGIGAISAVFTLVNAVLLDPLPFPEPDRLVLIQGQMRREQVEEWPLSYLDVQDLAKQSGGVFSGIVGVSQGDQAFNLTAPNGEAEHVNAELAAAGFFRMLGVSAAHGRTFTADEDRPPDAARVVVLGDGLFRRRFGGDAAAVGRTIQLDGQPYQIVGVMPPGFRGLSDSADLWVPAGVAHRVLGEHYTDMRRFRWMTGLARLAPGVAPERAQQAVDAATAAFEKEYPDSNQGLSARVIPLAEAWFGNLRFPLLALLGASGFVLFIACINLAGLLLARGTARRREVAMRTVLGAGRGRLVRELLAEGALLSLLGCALGLLLGHLALRLARAWGAIDWRSFVDLTPDARVILVTLAAALVAGLIAAAAPALVSVREDLKVSLHEAGPGSTVTRGHRRLQSALVVAQVALALGLLASAGLMVRGLQRFLDTDLGFNPDNLLTVRMDLPRELAEDNAQFWNLSRALLARVRQVPGVASVGLEGPGLPTSEGSAMTFSVEEAAAGAAAEGVIVASRHHVDPSYFRTVGIPLVAGRNFGREEEIPARTIEELRAMMSWFRPTLSIIVNRELARRCWPGQDPLGKKLIPGPRDSAAPPFTVVGVVADARHAGLAAEGEVGAEAYLALFQSPPRNPPSLTVLVRTRGSVEAMADAVQAAIKEVAPNVPTYEVMSLADRIAEQTARPRFLVLLMGIFAAVALALAAVGVYGVLAQTVAQRTREIGIRMALGADRGSVWRGTLSQALRMVLLGAVLGLGLALALGRTLTGLLYGVSPGDPSALVAAAVVLVLAGVAAAALPAWRALRVDPARALRAD